MHLKSTVNITNTSKTEKRDTDEKPKTAKECVRLSITLTKGSEMFSSMLNTNQRKRSEKKKDVGVGVGGRVKGKINAETDTNDYKGLDNGEQSQ